MVFHKLLELLVALSRDPPALTQPAHDVGVSAGRQAELRWRHVVLHEERLNLRQELFGDRHKLTILEIDLSHNGV